MQNMTNKKTILIPVGIAAAVIATILVVNAFRTPDTITTVSAQIAEIDIPKATKLSDTIILGTVSDIRTESWNDPSYPLVKIVTVNVEEYPKNSQDAKTIEIRGFGEGIFDDPVLGRSQVEVDGGNVDFKVGEKVLVFLDYDAGNVMGDGYYVVGAFQGKYSIEDGMAKNADSNRDTTVEELRETIRDALEENQ